MAVATAPRQSGSGLFASMMRTAMIFSVISVHTGFCTGVNKTALKEQALEMFRHAYWSYMNYAFPHDELMPLSCTGRIRGVTPSRGDVDDSLGNFSLTLVDTLDTLVVMGEYDEFERAAKLVVEKVRFDADVVVSVFETNIRMVGGLISGHLMARLLKSRDPNRLVWYDQQLLDMATELGDRLLPAFNTTSGLPYPRINLRRGVVEYLREQKDTCTACGGTMILEMVALSRLTGNPVYEQKATKAMDFLWQQRHRGSDLMGTVLNVHSGDWVRRDSGIGAGIDSYYEYCLKAYILLGDEMYLTRFNTHYDAVMRYVNKGPMFIDVHMHKPTVASRPFMDSLLAFWPGLQVLKGDLKPAIEIHEMLHQVVQRHKFLPEAFTHDLQVHWAQHPLRPEFVESTYFLYRATKDEHYLLVAQQVMKSLNQHSRVKCGFAGVKDLRTMQHEDRMDSFVLAETFKYLYMIFAEPSDLILDPDSYVFTTEAHFIPLSIGASSPDAPPRRIIIDPDELLQEDGSEGRTLRSACPNTRIEFRGEMSSYAKLVRGRVSVLLGQIAKSVEQSAEQGQTCTQAGGGQRLKATSFIASNKEHVEELQRMGIQMTVQTDGRVQLTHSAAGALSPEMSEFGVMFMQEMIQLAKQQQQQEQDVIRTERIVQIVSGPLFGSMELIASPAQFGAELNANEHGVEAMATIASPYRACRSFDNQQDMVGRIVIVERSDCMFQEKARFAQTAGAVGVIVVDNFEDTSAAESPFFAMSGDGSQEDDINIPVVFLFRREGNMLIDALRRDPALIVRLAEKSRNPARLFVYYLLNLKGGQRARTNVACPLNDDGECGASCVEKGCENTFSSKATASGAPTNDEKECVTDGTSDSCVQRVGDQLITARSDLPAAPFLRPIAVVDDRIGHRQIKFNFDLVEQIDPPTSTIEEKRRAVDSLMSRFAAETNVNTLPRSHSYMAVVRKLAFIALGVDAPLGEFDKRLLGEMVSELVVKHQHFSVVGTIIESQVTCSLRDDGAVSCARQQEDIEDNN